MLSAKASDKVLWLKNLSFRTFIPIMLNLEEPSVIDKLSRFCGDKVKMFSSNPCVIRESGTRTGHCWLEGSSLHPSNSSK